MAFITGQSSIEVVCWTKSAVSDRLHFFFSFELSYLRTPQKPRLVGLRGFTVITPCHRHHHCAEWSCVVLSRWSRHRNGSGRDWPHKATSRQLGGSCVIAQRVFGRFECQ